MKNLAEFATYLAYFSGNPDNFFRDIIAGPHGNRLFEQNTICWPLLKNILKKIRWFEDLRFVKTCDELDIRLHYPDWPSTT